VLLINGDSHVFTAETRLRRATRGYGDFDGGAQLSRVTVQGSTTTPLTELAALEGGRVQRVGVQLERNPRLGGRLSPNSRSETHARGPRFRPARRARWHSPPRSARLRALWQKATKLRLSVLGSAGPPTSTTARPAASVSLAEHRPVRRSRAEPEEVEDDNPGGAPAGAQIASGTIGTVAP